MVDDPLAAALNAMKLQESAYAGLSYPSMYAAIAQSTIEWEERSKRSADSDEDKLDAFFQCGSRHRGIGCEHHYSHHGFFVGCFHVGCPCVLPIDTLSPSKVSPNYSRLVRETLPENGFEEAAWDCAAVNRWNRENIL